MPPPEMKARSHAQRSVKPTTFPALEMTIGGGDHGLDAVRCSPLLYEIYPGV